MLTSKSTPKLKQARALRQRKAREATGLFLVEGITQVGAALAAGAAIEYLCYAPALLKSEFGKQVIEQAGQRKIDCLAVSAEVFDSLADKDHPAGLLAVVRKPVAQSLVVSPPAVFVALVAPQDPGNIGTILRTIDAVGADGLILLDGGADPYHPNAVRASLGALFYKPIRSSSFEDFRTWAREAGCLIVGTSATGEMDYREAGYRRPLILLMGNEQKGLTAEQRAACDRLVRLPMAGKVSSLNLAVATGVMLYAIYAAT